MNAARMQTAPGGGGTPTRGLTRSSVATREGLGMEPTQDCAIPTCERPRKRREWCGAHYARFLRHGSPLGGGEDRLPAPPECAIDGCVGKPKARGLCRSHDKKRRAATDPTYREKRRAEYQRWSARNIGHLQEAQRRYRAENAGQISERMAVWRGENTPRLALHSWTRRRRDYRLPLNVAEMVDPAVVYLRDEGTCQICGDPTSDRPNPDPESATVDHVLPARYPDAEHSYANAQLAHLRCNQEKNALLPDGTDARRLGLTVEQQALVGTVVPQELRALVSGAAS